jgi:hypothetical protein
MDYSFDISGTTPAQQGWDAKGTVTLREIADDFVPMVQRAIVKAFDQVATGATPIAGPYQITNVTITAIT